MFEKFETLRTANTNIVTFRRNKQYIMKGTSSSIKREIYKCMLAVYMAMLNMTEEKREMISKKIIEINVICNKDLETKNADSKSRNGFKK